MYNYQNEYLFPEIFKMSDMNKEQLIEHYINE